MLKSKQKRIKALKWIEVENVWGIGFRHARRLKNLNVNNAYDFYLFQIIGKKTNECRVKA